jgi:hypothetical protein
VKKINEIMFFVFIILLVSTALIMVSGCETWDSCQNDCGCGDDEDTNTDGANAQEQIPNTLTQVNALEDENTRQPGPCDGVDNNDVSATASKSNTDSGYAYSYSYVIKACSSALGYNIILDGPVPKVTDRGVAPRGKETTGSNSYTSTNSYTQLCINTGDSAVGKYCVPFS